MYFKGQTEQLFLSHDVWISSCQRVYTYFNANYLLSQPECFIRTEMWWPRGLIEHNQFLTLDGSPLWVRIRRLLIALRFALCKKGASDVSPKVQTGTCISCIYMNELSFVHVCIWYIWYRATDTKVRGLNGCNLKIWLHHQTANTNIRSGKRTKRSMAHLLSCGMA
jgi:hypothetical protein